MGVFKFAAKNYADSAWERIGREDFVGAIRDSNKAIDLDPDLRAAYFARGRAKKHQGDTVGALEDYSKAAELAKDAVDKSIALTAIGLLKYSLSRYEEAISAFSAAIALDPTSILALWGRGRVKTICGDNRGALEDLTIAIQHVSVKLLQSQLLSDRGYAKWVLHDWTGALEDCTKAIDLWEKNGEAYGIRGRVKMSSSDRIVGADQLTWKPDLAGAIEDFTKAISLGYKTAPVYGLRGTARLSLGQMESGTLDFVEAKRLLGSWIDTSVQAWLKPLPWI